MADLSPTVLTGVTALAGTLVGGLTSFWTNYLTQRRQGHTERVLRSVERREDLYAQFNKEAAKVILDALESENGVDDLENLIAIATLAGRIRLASSPEVLEAAEAVIDYVLDTYRSPAVNPREMLHPGPRELLKPLIAFTEACRNERLQMLRNV